MVSGSDALLRVDAPENAPLDKVVVRLNGADVTSAFHADPATHSMVGLVTGLKVGKNSVQVLSNASSQGRPAAQIEITDHPITGPVFSGPQEQPYICQTQDFKLPDGTTLGPPLDANCSVKTVVTYVYKSTASLGKGLPGIRPGVAGLEPLTDRTKLPADVATTTTSTGETVPYVVRVETGTINRAIYQIAVLHDPTKELEPTPFTPPKNWNKRLMYTFGEGCVGGWYKQGTSVGYGSIVNDEIVGKGYAEASSTLNVFGVNCNDLTGSESMMMVKEHFIKTYGPPLFTMSRGGSGGAYQQNQTADNYPGLTDGIVLNKTFPDVMATTQMAFDSQLLQDYFTKIRNPPLTEDQMVAIAGVGEIQDLLVGVGAASRINPTKNCPKELPKEADYDPHTNPKGARCDLFDHAVNVYGRDPHTGFARRPVDNTGVQYGLTALNEGKITPALFLDLNEKMGGFDNDGNIVPARAVADPLALRVAYQTGRVTSGGGGLSKIPIIDVRPYRDMLPRGDAHLKYHSFALRARLMKANGTIANDVMITGTVDSFDAMEDYGIAKMDEWLTELTKHPAVERNLDQIVRAKPADLVDACTSPTGERIAEPQTITGGKCNDLYKAYASPRMIAGGPLSNDNLKCQLKPISDGDYKVKFSATEKARLAAIFPQGVCDWSKPGVEQQKLAGTWMTFGGKSPAPAETEAALQK